ncbi:MAG: hypothetical protein RLZZ165_230, partial [Bacteroidota bacterium]
MAAIILIGIIILIIYTATKRKQPFPRINNVRYISEQKVKDGLVHNIK